MHRFVLLSLSCVLALPSPVEALRAAPRSVTDEATVVDLQQNVLREGTNGWTCLPDDPAVPGDAPMCVDEPWLSFLGA